jgi:hypothetical protein
MLPGTSKSFFPVVCSLDAITFLLEIVLQQLENVSLVIDYQYGGSH